MFELIHRRRDQRRISPSLIRLQCGHAGVIDELHAAADKRHDAARAARDVNEIEIQALLVEKPRFLGDPDRRHRTGDGAVAGVDFLRRRGLEGSR